MRRVPFNAGSLVALILVTAFGASLAFASDLPQASGTLGANAASVSRCDTDGVGIVQNLSGANVISVTISGMANACANGSLSVTLNNGTANSSGTGTVPAGGAPLTVALSAAVPARDVEEIDLAISGP